MHPFQQFRLKRPPFEAAPDPRIFCAAEPHAEALATLEYAIYSRKPCTVLVGESGTGKTLLARMMAATASLQATVLWLHGLGQPETHSELYVFPRGTLTRAAPSRPPTLAKFSDWLRDQSRASPSTVLIVDNADGLPSHGWRDLLILLSREVLFAEPVRIGLFGLPVLLRQLEAPNMVQIRRRIFRTSVLQPLSRREICAYVSGRLAAAGGRLEEIFAPEALDQIHRLTRGIPAAINQLCENAMLEALSARRCRVAAADILAAAQVIRGQRPKLHLIWNRVALLNEPYLRLTTMSANARKTPAASLPPPAASAERTARADRAAGADRPANLTRPLGTPPARQRTPAPPPPGESPARSPFMLQVQRLEQRLQDALTAMQRACDASQAACTRSPRVDALLRRASLSPVASPKASARPEHERTQSADQNGEVQVH